MADLDFYGESAACQSCLWSRRTAHDQLLSGLAAQTSTLTSAGFPLRLSAQQAGARAVCDNTEKKVDKSWFKYAKKSQVPSGDDRKKMCRKVRADADSWRHGQGAWRRGSRLDASVAFALLMGPKVSSTACVH